MKTHWLGLCPYLDAVRLAATAEAPTIVGSENLTCITLGRRSDLLSVEVHTDCPKELPIYTVDRGGHATLHNPGQLVIYPTLRLADHQLSVRDYVCTLAKTTVQLLENHGIRAYAITDPKQGEPGIYTGAGKIGFMGVRISRGVTSHGVSINVRNQLTDFAYIRSCSVWGQKMDSFLNQGVDQPLDKLFFEWAELFSQSFDLTQCVPTSNVKPGNFKPLRA